MSTHRTMEDDRSPSPILSAEAMLFLMNQNTLPVLYHEEVDATLEVPTQDPGPGVKWIVDALCETTASTGGPSTTSSGRSKYSYADYLNGLTDDVMEEFTTSADSEPPPVPKSDEAEAVVGKTTDPMLNSYRDPMLCDYQLPATFDRPPPISPGGCSTTGSDVSDFDDSIDPRGFCSRSNSDISTNSSDGGGLEDDFMEEWIDVDKCEQMEREKHAVVIQPLDETYADEAIVEQPLQVKYPDSCCSNENECPQAPELIAGYLIEDLGCLDVSRKFLLDVPASAHMMLVYKPAAESDPLPLQIIDELQAVAVSNAEGEPPPSVRPEDHEIEGQVDLEPLPFASLEEPDGDNHEVDATKEATDDETMPITWDEAPVPEATITSDVAPRLESTVAVDAEPVLESTIIVDVAPVLESIVTVKPPDKTIEVVEFEDKIADSAVKLKGKKRQNVDNINPSAKKMTKTGEPKKYRKKKPKLGEYRCDTCNAVFRHPNNLSRHKKKHNAETKTVCQFCGYIPARQDYLAGHQKSKACIAARAGKSVIPKKKLSGDNYTVIVKHPKSTQRKSKGSPKAEPRPRPPPVSTKRTVTSHRE